jgi:type I restriction enzyme S subunit
LENLVQPRSERISPADRPDAPYIGLEHVQAQSNEILGTVPASSMASSSAIFDAGDILYGRMRPYLNKVVRPDFSGLASAEFIIFPKSEALDSNFLLKRLSAVDFVEFACSQYEGDRPRVKYDALGKFQIDLPPRAEQARIVAKLEELLSDLDAGLAELKAAQKKLAQYRQALLKAAVEGALTAEWRAKHMSAETGAQLLERILIERRARWEAKQLVKFEEQGKTPPENWQKKYPEPMRPDTTNSPELPHGWVWTTMDQLSELITSGSRGWANYYSESGATFIRSQNINKDRLDLTDIAFVHPPRAAEGARTRVRENDLLLTITGANVGKAARVDVDIEEAYVSQHVSLMRMIEPAISDYMHLFLTSSAGGRAQLDKEAYGAGKPGLNLQQVAAVSVPLPGLAEIHALIEAISMIAKAANEQDTSITLSLKQSTAQRQNILRAAFAGRLVPQHPNDEPASVLLERIRAEGAKREQQPKVRKTKQQKEIATVVSKLIDVLAAAGDWLPAQEAFQRCGVADGAETDQVEALYSELRVLDKAGRLVVEAVTDEQGRKLHDRLKLLAD